MVLTPLEILSQIKDHVIDKKISIVYQHRNFIAFKNHYVW